MKHLLQGLVSVLLSACSLARAEPAAMPLEQGNTTIADVSPVASPTPNVVIQQPTAIPPTQAPLPLPTLDEQQRLLAELPNYGLAPELDNIVWLNSDMPLRLAGLLGNVVLLDFWTFDCINCIHTIPSLREWHYQYGSQGLVIIGNHYPEFAYERDLGNLRNAIARLDVPYAVAQDNDGTTWRAYGTRYWPTMVLIDKYGYIRYRHIGEGRYDQTEAVIQALLAESYPWPR